MKFYESHYEDYYHSVEKANLHEELVPVCAKFPSKLDDFQNMIVYGPSGSGKYSQTLNILKPYSHTHLKYDKKLTASTEKQSYIYKISDIHYEIDMGLLGCNSKVLWHEIFLQIVDIISIKQDKIGIIVCKNFHQIHNELLDIFYSYMQQYSDIGIISGIKIKFVLITEHVSFLPNNILNSCFILHVGRPSKPAIKKCIGVSKANFPRQKVAGILDNIDTESILNNKEVYSFSLIKSTDELPRDHFNTICDSIIDCMENYESMVVTQFRDNLYDVLIYNLDVIECVWYIFSYFVQMKKFDERKIEDLMEKIHLFLKQFGNNYRAIFHLENICFAMICAFHEMI
jgi:hypothetical protein